MKKINLENDEFEEKYFQFDHYDNDYKMSHAINETRNNFLSTDKWLYLGADNLRKDFAKIGITMHDLKSRSYSSESPGFHLFCAFKFKYDVSTREAREIENSVLLTLDDLYRNADGSATRLKHFESGRDSECFYPVDFLRFFVSLHDVIYTDHRNYFVISGYENEYGGYEGEFVGCIFNTCYEKHRKKYIRMILQ